MLEAHCPGGSRTVLTEPDYEMVERTAKAIGDMWIDTPYPDNLDEIACTALTAALFVSEKETSGE
jgi:histidinol-phosphate/aromatic aminotransferase/cobyric acid decarboxylase-like protein